MGEQSVINDIGKEFIYKICNGDGSYNIIILTRITIALFEDGDEPRDLHLFREFPSFEYSIKCFYKYRLHGLASKLDQLC